MIAKLQFDKTALAIGLIWLLHISAIIGIGIGYQDWFVGKTPINLLLCFLLFIWVFPVDSLKKWIGFALFFLGGMFAEWLGVHYGLLFGNYSYGSNLGYKLAGVPLLIGINWALLTFISAGIVSYFTDRFWSKVILSALLMVILDYLMEHSAAHFDFWSFEGGLATLENYISWLALAFFFQLILQKLAIAGSQKFSFHLYMAQFTFFGYFFFLG